MKGNAAKARFNASHCPHGKRATKCKVCLKITEDVLNTRSHSREKIRLERQ